MPVTYMVQGLTPRVQVPNNHILAQNLYYNYYYPKPKYLIIGYMDPLGKGSSGFQGLGQPLGLPFRLRIEQAKGSPKHQDGP